MTLIRQHFDQSIAAAAATDNIDLNALTVYQRLYKSLKDDKAILKNIASIKDKIKAKSAMIPNYSDWIQGVIDTGRAAEDDQVTPTLLVWMIDTGALDQAMPLAQLAIETQMASTDEYSRTMPEIIIEQMAEQISAGSDISLPNLQNLIDWVTAKSDGGLHINNMPDQIRAKLLKAAGERAEEQEEIEHAIALYEQAIAYNERCGVKKRLDALKKQLEK